MMTIEQVGPDAWRRVRAVRLRALQDAPEAFWTTVAEEAMTTEARWRDRLGSADAATFLACDGGADVGIVVGAPHHAVAGDAGLYAMWVDPGHRRASVAVALIEAVIAWARDAGHDTLRLEVADANAAAVSLYERMGFTPTGVTQAMPAPRQHITEHERARDLRVTDATDATDDARA